MQQYIVPNLLADPDVARYCNNLKKPDGSSVPGIVIPFGSTIDHTRNFFGLPGAAGDHVYSPSSYATKISSAGLVLKGYVGMDPYASGAPGAGGPSSQDGNALKANPYVYFIPCGTDSMLAPPLGDTNTRLIGRSVWNSRWKIVIPAYTLLSDELDGLNRFVASVTDIQLFLRTYSNSGN